MPPPHNPAPADVVVIGGGIMGVSTAYHLALLGAGKILLLERESMLGPARPAACAGGFRHQFSTEINIRLSIESIQMILDFESELGWPVDLHQDGYLFLLSTLAEVESFSGQVALQNSWNVPSALLEPEELARLAPYINLEGIAGGAYLPSGRHRRSQRNDARVRRRCAPPRGGGPDRGVRPGDPHRALQDRGRGNRQGIHPLRRGGKRRRPHAREVAAWAGADLPVHPQRRHVYTTLPFPQAPPDFLMVIDYATTFYCHRESGGVLMVWGIPRSRPDSISRWIRNSRHASRGGPQALPGLQSAGIARSWAGLYEMTPDAHPVLGRVEQVSAFYLINGFSGHGFQHAPIAGKLVAEELVYGEARTLDIGPLRLARSQQPRTLQSPT